jgi:spermidine/putrescine-binding protein
MHRVVAAGVLAGGVVIAAACGSSSSSPSPSATASQRIGGSVTLWAEWTAQEQADFLQALQPFENQTGITVNYSGKGSNMDTTLESAIQGGAPPDVALSPSPATLQTLAKASSIKEITSIVGNLSSNFGSSWNQLATYNGKLYGVWFKAANKNTIWYNPAQFGAAGIKTTPGSWEDFVKDAGQLQAAGVPPTSLCVDVGWPLADMWQNLYLKTAGPDMYNKLANHDIKWTDASVTTAFTTMAQLVGKPQYLLGGLQGSLSNAYPDCVDKVFPKPPAASQAAQVIEADFVTSEIVGNSTSYNAGTTGSGGASCTVDTSKTPCYDFFPFPAPSGSSFGSAIQSAGDVAMMLTSTPQAQALIKYLAGAQGAAIWAKLGGFASPNKAVSSSAYPNSVALTNAQNLANASSTVFSLDDLQGSWEKSMWQDLINFLKDPSPASVTSIQATMEQQATAALGH